MWKDAREQELTQCERFVRRELLREVRQRLGEAIFQLPTQIQEHYRTITERIVKDAQRNVFERYRGEGFLRTAVITPSLSAAAGPGTLELENPVGNSLWNDGLLEGISDTTAMTTIWTELDFSVTCDQTSTSNEEWIEDGCVNPLDLDPRHKRAKHQHDESGEETIPVFLAAPKSQGAAGLSAESEREENAMSPSCWLPEEDPNCLGPSQSGGV